MSNLVVVGFEDEHTAFAMRAELSKLQKEYLIEMEDVVVVTKNEKGKVKLHQAVNLTAAGAVGGTFWGMLIGLIFLLSLFISLAFCWFGIKTTTQGKVKINAVCKPCIAKFNHC